MKAVSGGQCRIFALMAHNVLMLFGVYTVMPHKHSTRTSIQPSDMIATAQIYLSRRFSCPPFPRSVKSANYSQLKGQSLKGVPSIPSFPEENVFLPTLRTKQIS